MDDQEGSRPPHQSQPIHTHDYAAPSWDVAMTFRAYACAYMIILAMYLNTLLLVVLNYTLPSFLEGRAQAYRTMLRTRIGRKESKHALSKEEAEMETFMRYDEQRTQEQKDAEGDEESKDERAHGKPKHDKTLKSARMSIRLPRAPKGHHVEELDQMEKFLAEDDVSTAEY